jgi:RND family efflux transporter MFP subunit
MKKKLIFRIAVMVIIIFLLWRIYRLILPGTDSDQQIQSRPPVAVEVDSIRYGNINEVRQLTGTVYPYYQYVVAPKVSGRMISISKRIGDWVKTGEVVARIDDAEYQQAVREAEANLKIAKAALLEVQSQLELSQQELERMESLQEKGLVASAELEAATAKYTAQQSRVKLTQAQVEQREATLKSAKIRLSYTVLTASEPGFVGERFIDEGTLLAPNAPVISVVGIDTVFVRTTVIERDYGRIKPGQFAVINVDAFPDKSFSGMVTRLAPQLREASRVAEMEVKVVNDSLILKPGMFAKLTVILQEKDQAQIIPNQAIVTSNGKSGVFIVKEGENIAHYVPVEIGIIGQQKTEVISPELEGRVITLGQHLLEDSSPVILPND